MQYSNHGANPELLYQKYNIKMPKKIIDFSTNTNIIKKRIKVDVNKLASSYPDYTHHDLKALLATRHHIDAKNIMVTSGINEIIYLLARQYSDKRIGLLNNDYTEYKRAFKNHNVFYFDTLSEVENVDILVFSNPNNPQGNVVDTAILDELSNSMLICIDESYIDFIQEKEITVKKNIIYFRSLTKIYHLSGLRIAYSIGEESILNKLTDIQPTWSVNSVALEAAKIYLKDNDFLEKTRKFYLKETSYFKNEIIRLGLEILDSDCNFFLIKISSEIIPELLPFGIVVRHTYNFPKLNGMFIRVSVKTRKDNQKLINAIKELKNEYISN